MRSLFSYLLLGGILCHQTSFADDTKVTVEIDVSEAEHLKKWAEDAKGLIIEWYPRIANLLPSKNYEPPQTISLKISGSYEGVAMTLGTQITVSADWIKEHPDDVGCVIHELAHVIQAYPKVEPHWLTEGIADYIRWAIYEGKRQEWFHRPGEKQGYNKGYRDAAGFLLWLDSDRAPGIVNKLNSAMRHGTYSEEMFPEATGHTLDDLWDTYASGRQ